MSQRILPVLPAKYSCPLPMSCPLCLLLRAWTLFFWLHCAFLETFSCQAVVLHHTTLRVLSFSPSIIFISFCLLPPAVDISVGLRFVVYACHLSYTYCTPGILFFSSICFCLLVSGEEFSYLSLCQCLGRSYCSLFRQPAPVAVDSC